MIRPLSSGDVPALVVVQNSFEVLRAEVGGVQTMTAQRSDSITRLTHALSGRYTIERELGEVGWRPFTWPRT